MTTYKTYKTMKTINTILTVIITICLLSVITLSPYIILACVAIGFATALIKDILGDNIHTAEHAAWRRFIDGLPMNDDTIKIYNAQRVRA